MQAFAPPKDELIPDTQTMPEKKINNVHVFNNKGFATYKATIPFARIKGDDSNQIFKGLVRGKLFFLLYK